jgi:serine phosphatase RsbU (regulator of sigma subunit)
MADPLGASGDQEALIERLMDQVATEQARLARVLEQLPEAIAAADVERVRAGFTEIARDVCDAPVALYLAQDDDDRDATVAAPAPDLRTAPRPRRAPLLSAAFFSDDMLAIEDVTRASTGRAARAYGSVDGRALRSWLAAPVRRAATADESGERLGVLFVGHPRAHAFDARHHHLLTAVARYLAVALDGARLVEEHVRVSAGLQETLLPPMLPRVEGADLASRYRPAGEASLIGGDFYDVFPAGGGRWVVAIGDVCGVGPEAAAVTGIARYTLRAVGREDPRPTHTLAALNAAILSRTVENRFCTAVTASIEPVSGGGLSVSWSNAGHPPPLVLRDDGRVDVLDERLGPLLGVLPEATFTEASVDLHSGDALILYTDGLTEARPAGGPFFGEARLAEVAASCAGRTADGIARRIELAVIDHIGGLPDDDVAILVVRAATRAVS